MIVRKQLVILILASVFCCSALPLLFGSDVLVWAVLEEPYIPLGNLLAALVLFSFVTSGHCISDTLCCPVSRSQFYFSVSSYVLIILAIFWYPLGFILANNFAGNFGTTDAFRGSVFAGNIYHYYTISLVSATVVLWCLVTGSSILTKNHRNN